LISALRDHKIAAAGLDVFENEPALHPDFLDLSNVVLTSHIASASEPTRRRVIRCAVVHRKLFLSDELVMKVIYLAISQAEKWNMPIQNWRMTLNRFMIQFKIRIQKYDH